MRSAHPFEKEEVMAYLDGEIPADRASEIAQHMQQCAECNELAASFRDLSHRLAAWEVEASPARLTEQMSEEVFADLPQKMQVESEVSGRPPLERIFRLLTVWRSKRLGWAFAAVLGLALVLISGLHYEQILNRGVGYLNPTNALVASHDGAPIIEGAPASRIGGKGVIGGTAGQSQQQALQQRMEQERLSNSLEKNIPLNGRDYRDVARVEPGAASPAPPPLPPSPGAASSPLIARTASLSLVVKEFGSVEAAVKNIVTRHAGYIGELNTSMPPDAAKTFSATLRVPSVQLDAALSELKQLGRVDQETQAGDEVTKQYTDLVARLKNSRATEQRLLDVLRNNTGKVKDVLEVENEISRVRGEIEEMEADQRALQTRIDFATITLSVTEEYKASLNGAPSATGTRLHNAFVTGYHGVVENVIGLLAWLLESGPTLMLWAALLFFPIRWAWRRKRSAFARRAAVQA